MESQKIWCNFLLTWGRHGFKVQVFKHRFYNVLHVLFTITVFQYINPIVSQTVMFAGFPAKVALFASKDHSEQR